MTGTVKKVWHAGCKHIVQRRGPQRGAADKNKKRRTKMNGLIKQTNLDGVNFLGSLTIAFSSVAVALYVLMSGGIA